MFKGDRNFTVGLFVTLAIAVFVAFVIWLTGRSGAEELSRYSLKFERDVSGLAVGGPRPEPSARSITLLQRKSSRPGKGLGKTTGWIHRLSLKGKGVSMVAGVNYEEITPEGLRISDGEARENPRLIPVDAIVLCAGQEPNRNLADALTANGITPHIIGGADVAVELDAKRAIDQGARLAARL